MATFPKEQIEASERGKDFLWDARTRPKVFDPVQLKDPIFFSRIDWWNTRSKLFCCCFPFMSCIAGTQTIEGGDAEIWQEQIENSDPNCPDSMKGLWWLKCNHAPEELVTIFSDAKMVGTFNQDGTDGYGEWFRPLRYNWTRDKSCFGLVFAFWGKKETSTVVGRMNMKDGICTVHGATGEGIQIVYRVTDDEWWKVHYKGNPGEPGDKEVNFMYMKQN